MPLPAFLSAHATTVQALLVTGLAPSPPPLLAVYTLVLDGGGEMADDPPPFSSSSRFIASLSPTLPSEFVAMDFQVVVLAGGASKNLAPLVSEEIPKALLPVANRPVLELLEFSNLKDLIVVVKLPFGDLGPKDVCTPENQELARDAAGQGIVLLKNNKGTLPLSTKTIKSLAIIGPNANASYTMIGNYEGIPCKYTTPLQGLSAVITSSVYQSGCQNVACSSNSLQLDPAKKATAGADATILIVGEDQSIEREALDRVSLLLPGEQTTLVTKVAKVAKGPVILVIMSGGGCDSQKTWCSCDCIAM